ncbi:MAG TPA: Fe-S protein assembly co-chaperone HscB [Rickettsiales bacterium]|nr:Fe-S protein assembly co-chaperone HscB [Rickettsiales bacterium]
MIRAVTVEDGHHLQDYFSLFGLARTFAIDSADLEKRYFAVQKELHPDRLAGKGKDGRRLAITQSMYANAAYETLKSPLKRAQYLLSLQGIKAEEIKPSGELLMEVMEMREQLAEAVSAEDMEKIEVHNRQDREKTVAEIAQAFEKSDLPSASALTTRLSYLSKMQDEIKSRKKALRR